MGSPIYRDNAYSSLHPRISISLLHMLTKCLFSSCANRLSTFQHFNLEWPEYMRYSVWAYFSLKKNLQWMFRGGRIGRNAYECSGTTVYTRIFFSVITCRYSSVDIFQTQRQQQRTGFLAVPCLDNRVLFMHKACIYFQVLRMGISNRCFLSYSSQ